MGHADRVCLVTAMARAAAAGAHRGENLMGGRRVVVVVSTGAMEEKV
jgi:hypothetical protein